MFDLDEDESPVLQWRPKEEINRRAVSVIAECVPVLPPVIHRARFDNRLDGAIVRVWRRQGWRRISKRITGSVSALDRERVAAWLASLDDFDLTHEEAYRVLWG